MKLKKIAAVVSAFAAATTAPLCAVGCGDGEAVNATPKNTDEYIIPQDYCRTYYEVFVRSFADGNGDGIGDLRGLADNLDYLNDGDDSTMTDLGINGIWMMPINMSPSYHKYDVTDYYQIDDEYGTMEDFDYLVEECNKRDIWLQMDLVLNHTSNQHPWFLEAVKEAQAGNPVDSKFMSRYEFVASAEDKATKGGTWRKVPGTADYWYLGNFSESMPDLNLSNRAVRAEIEKIVDFWLGKGIRSFRLDAVPWACANTTAYTEENAEFWTWFNEYCNQKGAELFGKEDDGINAYCYNVGEVWANDSTVKAFFGTKMSNFNYGFGDSHKNGFAGYVNDWKAGATITESLEQMQNDVLALDENAILSNFLSNHDNDRSAESFDMDKSLIKMGAAIYLLSPGNPYIYYGEEIGAVGSGRDENKRLAFNWGDKRNVKSPIDADYEGKQKLGSVKSQKNVADSILTYYRNAIKLRNRFPEIGRGRMTAYAFNSDGVIKKASEIRAEIGSSGAFSEVNRLNKPIAAYSLEWNGRKVFIVHNVGASSASLNLSGFSDYQLVASLKAKGGSVSFKNESLKMSSGTVAVLKPKTELIK